MIAPHRLIWAKPGWPGLTYDAAETSGVLADASRHQGVVIGKLSGVGMSEQTSILADSWTREAIATAAIEGQNLNLDSVRSSIARRLGTVVSKEGPRSREVEGLLDLMNSAIRGANKPLTADLLCAWQESIFPSGFSGAQVIVTGVYRRAGEPMQIVSGPYGRETVHYIAPPAERVQKEMNLFLDWINSKTNTPMIEKAALAHLWFESIHPFEDGNGRVGRAIIDWVAAREIGENARLIRISEQLLAHRADYYAELEAAQHGDIDVTRWVKWFVGQYGQACLKTAEVVDLALAKAHFLRERITRPLNARQHTIVERLLDAGPRGFEGDLSTKKYEIITGAARATAYRDLADLCDRQILHTFGEGPATRYYIDLPGWEPRNA
jgi:Fic family protein